MLKLRSRRFRSNFKRELAEHEGTIAVVALIVTLGLFFLQDCSSAHVLHEQVKAVEENARSLKGDIETLNSNTQILHGSIQSLDTALEGISGAAGKHIQNFREITGDFSGNIESSLDGQDDLIRQIDSLNANVSSLITEMKKQNRMLQEIEEAGSEMRMAARDIRTSAKKVEVHSDRVVENTTPEYVRLYFVNTYFDKPINSTVYDTAALRADDLHRHLTSKVVNRQHFLTDFGSSQIDTNEFIRTLSTWKDLGAPGQRAKTDDSSKAQDTSPKDSVLRVKIDTRGVDMTDLILNIRFPSFLRGSVRVIYNNPNRPGTIGVFEEATSTIDDDVFYISVPLNTNTELNLEVLPSTIQWDSNVNINDLKVFHKSAEIRIDNVKFDYFVLPYYCMPDNSVVNPHDVIERDALVIIPNTNQALDSIYKHHSGSISDSTKSTDLHDIILTEFFHMIPREIK